MGSTPRAAAANWRERKQREWAELMVTAIPESLTPLEVQPEERDITRPGSEVRRGVTAWVRYAGQPVSVKGFAVMWTEEAMKVRWLTPKLEWHEAWVWISAVRPRTIEHGEDQMPRLGRSVNSPPQTPEDRRAAGLGDR